MGFGIFLLSLSGCGDTSFSAHIDGGATVDIDIGDDDDDDTVVNGQVSLSPLVAASVQVFELSSGQKGRLLGFDSTNSDGRFSISLGDFEGDVLIESTNGTYVEEATGSLRNASSTRPLRSTALDLPDQEIRSVNVTPFTSMAVERAESLGDLTPNNLNTAILEVQANFANLDLFQTAPIDTTASGSASGASQSAQDYGFLLAGLSQLAADLQTTSVVITQLLEDDFSDGVFDGKRGSATLRFNNQPVSPDLGRDDLADAITTFANSFRNASGAQPRPAFLTALRLRP